MRDYEEGSGTAIGDTQSHFEFDITGGSGSEVSGARHGWYINPRSSGFASGKYRDTITVVGYRPGAVPPGTYVGEGTFSVGSSFSYPLVVPMHVDSTAFPLSGISSFNGTRSFIGSTHLSSNLIDGNMVQGYTRVVTVYEISWSGYRHVVNGYAIAGNTDGISIGRIYTWHVTRTGPGYTDWEHSCSVQVGRHTGWEIDTPWSGPIVKPSRFEDHDGTIYDSWRESASSLQYQGGKDNSEATYRTEEREAAYRMTFGAMDD
jgi:hypothetical protein